MTEKKVKGILLAVLTAISLLFLLEKNFLPKLTSKSSPQKNLELVRKVVSLVRTDYIEEPDPVKTMSGAFKGLVDSLDTLSCYLDKESMLKYSRQGKGYDKNIGIILYKSYGFFPQVVGVVENSPAEKNGIQVGDYVSALDDRSTLMMSLLEINLYLKNKDSDSIRLKILRGNKTQEVSVKRATLYSEPFSFAAAQGTCGILKIHQLFSPCVKKIKEDVIPKVRQEKRTLILDLRNCHEGHTEEARKLINLFLKEPKIGYFEKKGGAKEVLSCLDEAELQNLPLVVWTNLATMGSAEMVAGVLQEFKRARVVGFQTLGLVANQDFFGLEDGSGVLLTSAIFRLESGKMMWEVGVTPDVKIEDKGQAFDSYLKKSLSSPF